MKERNAYSLILVKLIFISTLLSTIAFYRNHKRLKNILQ